MKYNGIECDFKKIKDYNKPNEFSTVTNMIQKCAKIMQTRHNEYMRAKAFEFIERKKKNPYNKEKYILFYTRHITSEDISNISFLNCSETAENYEEALAIEELLRMQGIRAVGIFEYKPELWAESGENKKVNKGNNDRKGKLK